MHHLLNDLGTVVLVIICTFVLLVVMGRLEPRKPQWKSHTQVRVRTPSDDRGRR